jgi:quercetin dioxygenase-like cupin family protein
MSAPPLRVIKLDPSDRRRDAGEIFVGDVERLTAVGEGQSSELRLSEIHFKNGARNRWHVHTTDQILVCTEGEGIIATEGEQHDLVPGVVALVGANTRHWHGAKPGKDMTHYAILGPAKTRIAD